MTGMYPYITEPTLNYWKCPACQKVIITNRKGDADQAKKMEQHLLRFHETNEFSFFSEYRKTFISLSRETGGRKYNGNTNRITT